MKNLKKSAFFVLIIFSIFYTGAYSQDSIKLKNGDEVLVKVDSAIVDSKYVQARYLDGGIFMASVYDIDDSFFNTRSIPIPVKKSTPVAVKVTPSGFQKTETVRTIEQKAKNVNSVTSSDMSAETIYNSGTIYVKGYYRKDGTYVRGYTRKR